MALKATIFKVKLSLSNLDVHFYHDFNLTLARHPSENNLRMMARLMAFVLNAQEENLVFTRGLSSDSEPELWKINHDSSIDLWIELGQLDERRIRQIVSKTKKAKIYTYQDNLSVQWFSSIETGLSRFSNLSIINLSFPEDDAIEEMIERGMNMSCTIEDQEIWLATENSRMCVNYKILKY